jgi:hypothetical protein
MAIFKAIGSFIKDQAVKKVKGVVLEVLQHTKVTVSKDGEVTVEFKKEI